MEIIKTCPLCRKTVSIDVPPENFINWSARQMPIQDAFPELTPSEREFIMTGMCLNCQDAIFGSACEDDDDEEEDDSYFWGDDDLEMGFDPYEGGYTYDC